MFDHTSGRCRLAKVTHKVKGPEEDSVWSCSEESEKAAGSRNVVLLQIGKHFRKNSLFHDGLQNKPVSGSYGIAGGQPGLADGEGTDFLALNWMDFFLPFPFRPETWECVALSKQSRYLQPVSVCSGGPRVLMQHLCPRLHLRHKLPHSCGALWVSGHSNC